MNFYKHHLGDYDGHTAHLSWDEDMAYTRLLRAYYRRESPVPVEEAYRLARATSKTQRAAVDNVLREFFTNGDGGWRNKRADEEIAAYQHQVSVNRKVGKLGGRPNRTETESVSSRNRTETEAKPNRNPNHKPEARSQEPEEPKSTPLASRDESRSAAEPSKSTEKVNGNAVAYIPLVDGSEFGIGLEALADFEKAYPAVDCRQTLLEMRAWCVANPKNRKTRGGVMRFVNSWLSREQNKAR